MLRESEKQYSIYSILYDRIPENHILKKINSSVDFSFLNTLLEGSYCKYYGRPAKEPEMMAKLLVLQHLYCLSDERVVGETSVNLAFMWFIGINPDDLLPDPSLLSKFRTQRLNETTLDSVITEIVRQCVEKGIIKGTSICIDTTHTEANTKRKVPERIMKHMAKKILLEAEQELGVLPEGLDKEIPDYKTIDNPKEAKAAMQTFVENLIDQVHEQINLGENPLTAAAVQEAREILDDPKFIQQRGVRSLIDKDARVGHKSRNEHFFGYKLEYTMIAEERIITGIRAYSGSYMDGTCFKELIILTLLCGLDIEEVLGDKAYFRKEILDAIKLFGAQPIIPVSEAAFRVDENRYSYNKDSDEWFCDQGNRTIKKKRSVSKTGSKYLTYNFERTVCKSCAVRDQCIRGKAIAQRIIVGINAPEYYEYSQFAKASEFKEKYKRRARQEGKNGEMKRFHGLGRARGYGLRSMLIQAQLTALAVNLKRIAHLASSLNLYFLCFW